MSIVTCGIFAKQVMFEIVVCLFVCLLSITRQRRHSLKQRQRQRNLETPKCTLFAFLLQINCYRLVTTLTSNLLAQISFIHNIKHIAIGFSPFPFLLFAYSATSILRNRCRKTLLIQHVAQVSTNRQARSLFSSNNTLQSCRNNNTIS